MPKLNIKIEGFSDLGKVRKNNEDYISFNLDKFGVDAFVAIADGMGGLELGEIASKESIKSVEYEMNKNKFPSSKDIVKKEEYSKFFNLINIKVNEKINDIKVKENATLGTTLTYGLIRGDYFYFCHIGDSRIYSLKEKSSLLGKSIEINQLTKDDNPDGSPSVLTKYIGANEPFLPQVGHIHISEIDYLLFSTDGLHDLVSTKHMEKFFKSDKNLSEINKSLVNKANDNGGRDNISLVTVQLDD